MPTSRLPTVLPPALEQLREEIFDEKLFSKTVDVHDVAAEFLTAFLRAVERRCLVDDRVTRSFLAAAGELGPTWSICANQHDVINLIMSHTAFPKQFYPKSM